MRYDQRLEQRGSSGARHVGLHPANVGAVKTPSNPAAAPRKRTAKPRAMPAADVRSFIVAISEGRPEPRSELAFTDTYTLLVAVTLSAQATDISVNKATEGLFRDAPNPAAMVRLGVDGVAEHIKTIGLWRGKARNVVALSQILLDRYGGEVPHDRAALEALPGVGRKTANVVLNVAFGDPTMAVDTHIFRIGNRTGLAPGATPRAVEDGLVKRIPADLLRDAHNWLILHGRYICKARKPECGRCPAEAWCRYQAKTEAPAA